MRKTLLNFFVLLLTMSLSYTGFTQFEGKVTYEIDYIAKDLAAHAYLSMLPKVSELYIKNYQIRFDQAIAGGGAQSFIANSASKSSTLVMQFMGQSFQVNLNEDQLQQLELTQKLKIVEGNKTKEICGHMCQEAFAISNNDSLQIFYAPHLRTRCILPQFADLKGLPLEYEVVNEELKIKYTCEKIEEKMLSETIFTVEEEVPSIPFEQFAQSFAIPKAPDNSSK